MESSIPTPAPATKPASRGRILLYALLPLLLLALLTGAVRLVTDAEQKQAAISDAPPPRRQPRNPDAPRIAPLPPLLKPADTKTRIALEAIVRGQLQAIATQDFVKALSFAVPSLRESTSPERFRTMIESGYAPMLSMKRMEIVNARVQAASSGGKTAMVDVVVVTRSGERMEYGYMLDSVGDDWQVQGVMLRVPRPSDSEQGDGQGNGQIPHILSVSPSL